MKILIVDDYVESLYLLETLLKNKGYDVVLATNGKEALEKLQTERVEMIISDILMPVMDGFQLCREVKRDDKFQNIPFVFYTATYTDEKDEDLALQLGAVKFIRKPIELKEFNEIIEDVIKETKEGKRRPKKPLLEDEKKLLKLYNEKLIKKLEKKSLDLEKEIAEHKRTEQELVKYREFLEELVQKRTKELTAVNEELQLEITERKQLEEALREKEERFRNFFENEPEYCYMISPDGKIIDINNSALKVLGYSKDEIIGKPFLTTIYTSSSQEKAKKLFMKWKKTGKIRDEEMNIVTKDGVERTILLSADTVRDAKGEIINSISIQRDITERKQVEESLKRAKEYAHSIIDCSLNMIIAVDKNRRIIEFNTAAQNTFGYSEEEILGKYIQILYADEKENEKVTKEISEKNIFIGEIINIKKNGETFPSILSASNMRDQHGEIIGLVGNSCDITEQKKAKEALRESEERYRLFVENFQGIAYQRDDHFKLILLHGIVENITGYKAKAFTSGRKIWEKIIHPDDLHIFYEDNNKLLSLPNFSCIREYRIFHKNGETRWIREIASNICDESDKPILIQGAVYNITDYMKEKEMSHLRQQQLIQAGKMASLGILVSGVAHEINNPNQYIMSNTSILQNLWKNIEPIIEKYYVENGDFSIMNMSYNDLRDNIHPLFSGILDGSDRIKFIVQELRDFARQGSNDMIENVEINSVVKSANILLSNMIKKTTEHFSVDLREKLPIIKGNYQRLEQVVINLIQNACQAISDKEKGIVVLTSYDKNTDCIVLEVRDEGVGIPKNVLQNITDPFYTTKRDSGGTGLGLSISSAIINDHRGSLTFTSFPGKGTSAKVLLPVKDYIEKRKNSV